MRVRSGNSIEHVLFVKSDALDEPFLGEVDLHSLLYLHLVIVDFELPTIPLNSQDLLMLWTVYRLDNVIFVFTFVQRLKAMLKPPVLQSLHLLQLLKHSFVLIALDGCTVNSIDDVLHELTPV